MPGNSGQHAITAAWRAVQDLTKIGVPGLYLNLILCG